VILLAAFLPCQHDRVLPDVSPEPVKELHQPTRPIVPIYGNRQRLGRRLGVEASAFDLVHPADEVRG